MSITLIYEKLKKNTAHIPINLICTTNTIFIRFSMHDARCCWTMIDAGDKSVILCPRVSALDTLRATIRSRRTGLLTRISYDYLCIEKGDVIPCTWLEVPRIS